MRILSRRAAVARIDVFALATCEQCTWDAVALGVQLCEAFLCCRKRSVESRVEAAWSKSRPNVPSDEEVAAVLAKEVVGLSVQLCGIRC